MIPLLIFGVLALVVWLLVWSIASLVKISSLEEKQRRLQDTLKDQARMLLETRRTLREQTTPPPAAPEAPPARPTPEPVPSIPAPLAPVAVPSTPAAITEPPATAPMPPVLSAPPPPARIPAPASRPAINWELFLGVKLFAWIGGLALFLGVAYFIKYSFDNNLIPPAVRMALGYFAGAGLLAGGVVLARRPYPVTAQTLCATGAVILYAVTFACRAVYHFEFFGPVPTFLLMVLITAAAFVVAVALEAQVVALLGMLGGFLTPVLLSTGVDNPLGLFGYIAVLDVGLLAVALRRRWPYLGALAALGTAMMEAGWVARFFTAAKVGVALNVFLGFAVLFLLGFLAILRRPKSERTGRQWLAGAAAGVALAALGFAFDLLGYPRVTAQPWFLFAFVFGADLCLLVLAVADLPWAKLHLAAGTISFLLLAAWTGGHATNDLLPWALGACLLFALLHTAFPLVLARVRPEAAPAWWAHLFPPAALLLALLTIAHLPDASWLVWPFVLIIDLLAIGVAVLTGALLAVAVALALTIVATGFWLLRVPVELAGLGSVLLLIGGFGVLFFAAGVFALRRSDRAAGQNGLPGWLATPGGIEHLPAMAAVLPFLLLVMVLLRMPLPGPAPVFGLALLLIGLLVGLARLLDNGVLPGVALACAALVEFTWLGRGFTPAHAGVTLGWYLAFYAVFAVAPYAGRRRFAGQLAPWVAAALAAPVHFYLVYQVVRQSWPNGYMGLIPAAFAIPALGGLVAARRALPAEAPRRLDVLAWFGGVALLFVTLIFPIQFERQWITLGWALEGAALLWLFHRLPHAGLRLAGVGLLIAAFVRLALNPAVLNYHPRTPTPIFNWYLYAYGLTTLCLLAGAWLLAPPRNRVLGANAPAILYSLAGVLAFLLVNLEIADFYNPTGQVLTFEFSGNFGRDLAYTIAWALFAFGLLVLGIARSVAATRRAAIGLLSVTLLKLFLHDLAHLEQLYRIVALIVVAVVAIFASFLYQRYLPTRPRT